MNDLVIEACNVDVLNGFDGDLEKAKAACEPALKAHSKQAGASIPAVRDSPNLGTLLPQHARPVGAQFSPYRRVGAQYTRQLEASAPPGYSLKR